MRIIKMKINSKIYDIKPISELTFNEYNKLVIRAEAVSLKEYLSVMTGVITEEILDSEIKCPSLPPLSMQLLDIQDHAQVMKEKRNVLEYNNEVFTLHQIEYNTFGKSYFFELVNQNDNLNDFQKAVYSLAIGLNKTHSMDDVTSVYHDLCKKNWIKVLPQAYYIHKRTSKRPIRFSIVVTMKLKRIKSKILKSLRSYARTR